MTCVRTVPSPCRDRVTPHRGPHTLAPTRTPTRPAIATQPLTPHRPPPACSHPQKHMPYAKHPTRHCQPNGRPSNRTVVFRGFLGATRTPTSTRLPDTHPPSDHRSAELLRARPPTEPLSAPFPCFRRRDAEHHRRDGSAQQQGGGDQSNPGGEFAWYFPESREQFRSGATSP